MYIFLYIYRLIDQTNLKKDITLNVFDRSIDELTQIDTLIMDDFFFVEREFNHEGFT